MPRSAWQVVKVEGWAGLWRGNMANVIRVVPNKGLTLMCSDMYKAGVMAALPGCNGATISSIAGGFAGITAVRGVRLGVLAADGCVTLLRDAA